MLLLIALYVLWAHCFVGGRIGWSAVGIGVIALAHTSAALLSMHVRILCAESGLSEWFVSNLMMISR
jgi:hypothetical protein